MGLLDEALPPEVDVKIHSPGDDDDDLLDDNTPTMMMTHGMTICQ